eukprot:CAMPEP_0177643800 /NCGR_PEP_ID=MMETSP0447-20121125/8341_1 /TAXON_ID=0 /ORGANISM="Stygamoeba regulata, Strain BSH-02190019" /LENGTH=254 /DNA_ID=CAMNT_0019146105 /DNA_START=336 /DNA_END=1100 /DNA_ORIENTATION=+
MYPPLHYGLQAPIPELHPHCLVYTHVWVWKIGQPVFLEGRAPSRLAHELGEVHALRHEGRVDGVVHNVHNVHLPRLQVYVAEPQRIVHTQVRQVARLRPDGQAVTQQGAVVCVAHVWVLVPRALLDDERVGGHKGAAGGRQLALQVDDLVRVLPVRLKHDCLHVIRGLAAPHLALAPPGTLAWSAAQTIREVLNDFNTLPSHCALSAEAADKVALSMPKLVHRQGKRNAVFPEVHHFSAVNKTKLWVVVGQVCS